MVGKGQAGDKVPLGGGHSLQHPSSAGQRGRRKGDSSMWIIYNGGITIATFVCMF